MASSFVQFTAVSGARADVPYCYLLEIDTCKILLDCGCDSNFDISHLRPLRKMLKEIDCCLLSHSSIRFIGGLTFLMDQGLSCPIYSTLPVHSMGETTVLELAAEATKNSLENSQSIFIPTREQVKTSFEKILHLKYQQPAVLERFKGLLLTPYQSGHTLGGAVWKITKDAEDILYAPRFNHKKDRHLDGFLFDKFHKPTVFICDCQQALSAHYNRKQRDSEFLEGIKNSLRNNSNVLIPVNASGRGLEVIYMLESYWNTERLPYELVLLAPLAKTVNEYAKSMLEWMGETVVKAFNSNRENPFDFKKMKIMADLKDLKPNSCVLAHSESLLNGFSRQLFAENSQSEKNLIIFTNLADELDEKIKKLLREKGTRVVEGFSYIEKVNLKGVELQKFLKDKQEKEQQQAAEEALKEFIKRKEENEEEEEDELMGDIRDLNVLKEMFWAESSNDIYFEGQGDKENGISALRNNYKVFPLRPSVKVDEYGEPVKQSDFINQEVVKDQEKTLKRLKEADVKEVEEESVPTKLRRITVDLNIKAELKKFDFDGLVDGRSLKTIIEQIEPKKLILIGGGEQERDYLAVQCKSGQIVKSIFTPKDMQVVNVSSAMNVMQATMSFELMERLKVCAVTDYEKSREYEVGYMASKLQSTEDDFEASTLIPTEERHEPLIVGNVRLSALMQRLKSSNLSSEFREGVLCVEDSVFVEKSQGEFIVSGTLDENFYAVKNAIYSLHAVI